MKINENLKKRLIMHMVESSTETFSLQDIKWVSSHMPLVQQFFAITDEERTSRNRVGATLVANQIRWRNRELNKKSQEQFKINNNAIPLLAHLYNGYGVGRSDYFDVKKRQTL